VHQKRSIEERNKKIREHQNRPCRRKQGEGKIRKAKRIRKTKNTALLS